MKNIIIIGTNINSYIIIVNITFIELNIVIDKLPIMFTIITSHFLLTCQCKSGIIITVIIVNDIP